MGRTARASSKGKSLLFLQPHEVGFLAHLKAARIPIVEYDFPANKLCQIQSQLEKLVTSNYYLNRTCCRSLPTRPTLLRCTHTDIRAESAKDGFRSYLHAYASHSLRSVFDIHKLDLTKVAKSFGFAVPPRVDLTLAASMPRDKKVQGRRAYGSQPSQAKKGIKRGR